MESCSSNCQRDDFDPETHYTICERKGLAEDARVYNELATGWSDILAASSENAKPVMSPGELEL